MTESEWLACQDPGRMLLHLNAEQARTSSSYIYADRPGGTGPVYQTRKQSLISDRKLRLFALACCEKYGVNVDLDPERDSAGSPFQWAIAWSKTQESDGSGVYNYKTGKVEPDIRAALLRDIVGNPFRDHRLPGPTCGTCGGTGQIQVHKGDYNVDVEDCPYCKPLSLWLRWNNGTALALAQQIYGGEETCKACDGKGGHQTYMGHGNVDSESCDDCNGTGKITQPFNPALMPVLGDALEDASCSDPEILDHCRKIGPHVKGCWVVDLLLGLE